MQALLAVQDLTVSFDTPDGNVKAVDRVSFRVFPGEAVGIVGESGCGKSVTAHAVMQLVPMPPGRYEEGRILFAGEDLLRKSEAEMQNIRGRHISMVFQDPMTSLNPVLSVGRQITEVLQLHQGLSQTASYSRAEELLQMVGIPEPARRLGHYPHEYSGGMRQRAMIAMALACHPRLLIADEPTTALDVTVQAQILGLLKELQTSLGTAIILISHDLGVIAGLCSRVMVMYAGHIVEAGPSRDVFRSARHPYTRGLLQSVPRLDVPGKQRLTAIEGHPPDLLRLPGGCHFHPRCPYAMQICTEVRPAAENCGADHTVACWRQHPDAPQVAWGSVVG